MKRKSLWTGVLLLALLLCASSSASADAISITSVSVNNFQLVSSSGTIVFSPPSSAPRTGANAVAVNDFLEESSDESEGPTLSQASASVTFANASAVSDFANRSLSANSNVIADCRCGAESQGAAILRQSFMIVEGSGSVDVTLSAMLQTMQNLVTDQFSVFAASDARIILQVSDVATFSFDSNLHIGPNESLTLQRQRQLSEVLTLQFNQQYNISVFVLANSRAAQNEVPEPTTVVLLVSGLGFMAGFVRKRRTSHG